MHRRMAVALAVCLVAALLVAALPATLASAEPAPVCGACGGSFEQAAHEEAVPANVTHSTATVAVHANGSATWTVTNRVNASAAERLRADPALLEEVARRAATRGWGLPGVHGSGEVGFRSASVDDRTVTLRFVDPDAGRRHAGVLVVDYLHTEGVRGGWFLNADTFTVVGPPGTAVVNDPAAAIDRESAPADAVPAVDGRRVTWQGSVDPDGPAFSADLYLAFGDAGTPAVQVDAALALATAPIWLDNVAVFVLPAVAVYGVLLVGVAAATRRVAATDADPARVERGVAAVGAVGVAAGLVATVLGAPGSFVGVATVYLTTGGLALARPRWLRSVRGALGVGAAGLALLAAVQLVVGGGFGATGRSLPAALRTAAVHLPVAVAPAFGVAVARAARRGDRRATAGAFLGALLALGVAGGVLVPYGTRPWGLLLVFTVGGAILAAVLGLPLAALGARRWAGDGDGPSAGRPRDDVVASTD